MHMGLMRKHIKALISAVTAMIILLTITVFPGSEDLSLESITLTPRMILNYEQKIDEELLEIDGLEVLNWTKKIQSIEWSVEIENAGNYEFHFAYRSTLGDSTDIQRRMQIDSANNGDDLSLFEVYLTRIWQENLNGSINQNSAGDDIRPRMKEISKFKESVLYDWYSEGSDNYSKYLNRDTYTIKMEYVQGDIEMVSLSLVPHTTMPDYDTYINSYKLENQPKLEKTIMVEAEEASIRSDPAVRREFEEDISVSPNGKGYRRLNTLGGERWRKPGQWAELEFRVPEDGLYKMALHVKQSWNDGLPSHRRIEIDDKVLFRELGAYKFSFNDRYKMNVLSKTNGEPFQIFLTKGKHTLKLTSVYGETSQIIDELNVAIDEIYTLYQDFVRLTSNTPDFNFDYEFERNVPDLIFRLSSIANKMELLTGKLENVAGNKTAASNFMFRTGELFRQMEDDSFKIARKLEDINQTLISLAFWINELEQQPLAIDSVQIGTVLTPIQHINVNLLERVVAFWRTFILSFIKDYDHIGNTGSLGSDDSPLEVWVARGNEWAELMKELADASFTPQTDIRLKINLLTADQLKTGGVNALMLAVAAGNAPDVCIGMDMDAPVEFAIRDAVVPLSDLEGFDELKDRFYQSLLTPSLYRGNYYAIPETMNFIVTFYRTDIMEDLGLQLPESWTDVYENILPVLYRNNKLFNYPSSTVLAQSNFNSFGTFLFQHKGALYSEDGMKSALNTPEAFRAFDEWTKLYTNYDFPIAANFFNRFRSGEMPIGIGGYDAYVLFTTAAPELRGKWNIAPVPGQLNSDGTISRAVTGISGTYGVILSQCDDIKSAWKFLDWWTSTEIQREYGQEIEALMGFEARWNTANKAAFESLPWEEGHIEILRDCFVHAQEKPVVLGGYFSLRHITNAWTRVVINGMKTRDSLEIAYNDINDELLKKQREYGVEEVR